MSDNPSTPFIPTPLAENVIEAAAELKDAAEARAREFTEAAGEKFQEWSGLAGKVLGDSKEKWKAAGDQAAAYVKENPGKAVLAGLGAGFVIGLLFRSNSK